MKYCVIYSNKPIKQIVEAKTPQDAIYVQAGLKEKKGLNITPTDKKNANCCVGLMDGKRQTQTYYSVSEQVLFAIIARFEYDEEFHIYHYKFFNDRPTLMKWFENRCKEDSVAIDDTVTLWLVQITPMTLQILQRLEKEENYEEMKKIVYQLNCIDTYSV